MRDSYQIPLFPCYGKLPLADLQRASKGDHANLMTEQYMQSWQLNYWLPIIQAQFMFIAMIKLHAKLINVIKVLDRKQKESKEINSSHHFIKL